MFDRLDVRLDVLKRERFVAGRNPTDLETDLMLRFALVRAAEVFGEAASKVSPEARMSASSIPWREIVAMRNRLIHAYFDVDHDVLWNAATEEIPPLLTTLRTFLPSGLVPLNIARPAAIRMRGAGCALRKRASANQGRRALVQP
jgi:uncharacterized protein with HEPN domain